MLSTLALTLFTALPQAGPPAPRGVTVSHLANEGFLLQARDASVLIDAFLEEPYSLYEALGSARLERLLAAEPPFDGAVTCLASHVHRDHFQAAPAAAYLRANPMARFLSSPQVVAALRVEDPEVADDPRVEAVFLPGAAAARNVGKRLAVRFLDLPHGGERWKSLQNLGHDLTLGGLRILHVGDADTDPASFRRHGLAEIEFDLALLPYWYFEDEAGRRLLREVIHARQYVACHVPPKEREDFRRRRKAVEPELWIPAPEDAARTFLPPEPAGADGR